MDIRGISPPAVTPFQTDGSLDLPRLRTHIDRLLAAGVSGIFVLGTTGEFYALNDAEKEAVIAEAVGHVAGGCRHGGDGAGIHARGRPARRSRGEARGGRRARSSPRTSSSRRRPSSSSTSAASPAAAPAGHLDTQPQHLRRAEHRPATVETLAACRTSSASRTRRATCRTRSKSCASTPPATFAVLMGRDTLILPALGRCGRGDPGVVEPGPETLRRHLRGVPRRRPPRRLALQARLAPVRLALSLGTGNGAVKEALTLMGRSCGPNRLPVGPLPPAKLAELRAVLEAAGLLE